ncbi:hypothetical protein HYG81_09020 [Natrinema zhouii]|uniref:hypothetical protein n=1 Tax=Natrinema zhouii TaxID=1710539 RepID=UPI001CFFFF9F|nr:hypothetical protein [Natrinema zhouii]QLK27724.2 hypothetical protein HYG81_09020 [Natrinema zhouii]
MSILVGALLLAGPSFGFSSFAADRTLGVTTAADSSTYLGIESEGDVTGTELKGNSDPLRVGTLSNNVNEPLEIQDVSVASIGDGTVDDTILAVSSPIPGDTIETDNLMSITVECAEPQSVGEREVTLLVDRVEGETVSIAGPTFNATVDIQCGKGKFSGSASVNASDIGTGDTTQTVSFDPTGVGSNGEVTIDFSDPQDNGGVNYTNVTDVDLTVQSGKGTTSFDAESSQLTYTTQGNEKDPVTIELSDIVVVGAIGESYQITYTDTDGRQDGDTFEIT